MSLTNDFGLPAPTYQYGHYMNRDVNRNELTPEQHQEIVDRLLENCNDEQRKIFDCVNEAILDNDMSKPKCFFVDGPGGTGKTWLFRVCSLTPLF